jgi:hypothetical protein
VFRAAAPQDECVKGSLDYGFHEGSLEKTGVQSGAAAHKGTLPFGKVFKQCQGQPAQQGKVFGIVALANGGRDVKKQIAILVDFILRWAEYPLGPGALFEALRLTVE